MCALQAEIVCCLITYICGEENVSCDQLLPIELLSSRSLRAVHRTDAGGFIHSKEFYKVFREWCVKLCCVAVTLLSVVSWGWYADMWRHISRGVINFPCFFFRTRVSFLLGKIRFGAWMVLSTSKLVVVKAKIAQMSADTEKVKDHMTKYSIQLTS